MSSLQKTNILFAFLEKLEKDLFQHVICRLPAQQNSQCPVDSGWGSRQSDRLWRMSCWCSRGMRAVGGAVLAAAFHWLSEETKKLVYLQFVCLEMNVSQSNVNMWWCVCTIRLGHDHGEVSDGSVGVAEPGAVKAKQDGGWLDLRWPFGDTYTLRWDRRAWKERGLVKQI